MKQRGKERNRGGKGLMFLAIVLCLTWEAPWAFVGTSLSLKEFDKPCLLSFSKWSKAIENREFV
jgi:hypothetical protein